MARDIEDGDDPGGGLVLATAPSELRPRLKLSASLAQASRDEFVYVGHNGRVLSPTRYRVQRVASLVIALGAALGGIGLSLFIGASWLSLLYLGSLAYGVNVWTRSERLKRGAALLAADRLEEAERELVPLTRSRWTTQTVRALAWQNLAGVATRRGESELALTHVRRCEQLFRRTWWVPLGPWRWINQFSEVQLLAQVGRVHEARSLYASMTAVPDGEYFTLLRMNAELMMAFAADDPRALPTDLHPWVRTALSTTSAELALAVLAWAYQRRGDAEMAEHLLGQARERIDPALFSRMFPQVWAWIEQA